MQVIGDNDVCQSFDPLATGVNTLAATGLPACHYT